MKKAYVKVNCLCRENGDVTPLSVVWKDGRKWEIAGVIHASTSPDGEYEGVRYTVLIGSAEKYLYRKGSRWYVLPSGGEGGSG